MMPKSKISKFIKKVMNNDNFIPILFIIGALIGILFSYNIVDIEPATQEDYKPLLEIQTILIEDFDNVYNYPDANIYVTDNNIKVAVENEQCGLNMVFDKSKNYLYTKSEDKATSIIIFIICIIPFGFMGAITFFLISIIVLLILGEFFDWLYDIREKKKQDKPYGGDIDH